jgi:hypothetical protein
MWRKKSDRVNLDKLYPQLALALEKAGSFHDLLFGKPLVVTSANDGRHSRTSRHYRNMAIDIRSWDKSELGQLTFHVILAHLAKEYDLAIFDERNRDKAPHWHIEIAD